MTRLRFLARLWYYFRLGYSTYLTFILGYFSTLVTVYYLAIRNLPTLLDVFPDFVPFAVLASVIGGPFAILIGWFHMKRTALFTSEVDINYESNPYLYKLPPGYTLQAWGPLYLELLVQMERLLDKQELLTSDDKVRISVIKERLKVLADGGMVGTPRRG
jgi:hypothetical protein